MRALWHLPIQDQVRELLGRCPLDFAIAAEPSQGESCLVVRGECPGFSRCSGFP
jgi:hypothetical protein